MSAEKKDVILKATNLCQWFPVKEIFEKTQFVKAVDNVSFEVNRGETLGIAGESGCGKSTLIRSCIRLLNPTSGSVEYNGKDITKIGSKELKSIRKSMQIVFQDPYSSLDDKYTVGSIIEEPLIINKICKTKEERKQKVGELLEAVGLNKEFAKRYPHEFSGGQRQRITIACALATSPEIVMLDEAVSALDVSVRAQILNLLEKLQRERNLTYVFVSHDMSVIEHICDRVIIMYLGNVMEYASKKDIFNNPMHPYTQALLSAVPSVNQDIAPEDRIILQGTVPSPLNPPQGCVFSTRCPNACERCKTEKPVLKDIGNGHFVACLRLNKNEKTAKGRKK